MKAFKSTLLGSCLAATMGYLPSSGLALDVVIIIDTTGSTGALLPNWKANMVPQVINPILAVDPNARFALVSHLDFPFSPYGAAGEYAYRLEAPLNNNLTTFNAALNALNSGYGGDTPESQLEAIYQANTGLGRDLNNDGDFIDPGEILPSFMGFNPITDSFTIHFTAPLSYHNDPAIEPNYPYAGVVNNPADMTAALNAMLANNNSYFAFVPTSLYSLTEAGSNGSQAAASEEYASLSGGAAEALADATGGDIYYIGSDASGLSKAVEEMVEVVRPCPPGYEPVELPWGVACVPVSGDRE